MGKYRNSKLHDEFSDFHWRIMDNYAIGNKLLMSDIDRIWMPISYGANITRPVCVIDIKGRADKVSFKEEQLYRWFINVGIPVFIMTVVSFEPVNISIAPYPYGQSIKISSQEEFVSWELQIRGIPESELNKPFHCNKREDAQNDFKEMMGHANEHN